MGKLKTLPNSTRTAEEQSAMRADILATYKPVLKNTKELCKKYRISRERVLTIYREEMKKKGFIVPRKKLMKKPVRLSGFNLEEQLHAAFTKVCEKEVKTYSEVLRGFVDQYVADYLIENNLTVEELLQE